MKKAELEKLLARVLAAPPGYGIDLFADLSMYRLENGQYAVDANPDGSHPARNRLYRIFKNAAQAVRYFERLRAKFKLGYDHETA